MEIVTNAQLDVDHMHRQRPRPAAPAVTVLRVPPGAYARYLKRPVDVVVAAAAVVVLLPVLAALAVAVRVKLGPGGIFYRQVRVGRNGTAFEILKFRSMLPDRRVAPRPYIGPERRRTHKSDNDPRHTPFGRFLRSSSLDELPQLFNVIRGDMSLVGPRPELVEVAAREGFLMHPRHLERPGMTGRFQVSELRAGNRVAAGLHLDVAYIANVRFRSDLAIVLKTLFVLAGRGS
jgi:lipopolysaccharide/colanic/teichoic acid biosynthesis glycosyltransferase